MKTIDCQRHLFDLPREVAYLNCATFSPFLKSVEAAGQLGLARRVRPWTMDRPAYALEADRARALFGQLIKAPAEAIAIVPSASYGVAVAAANLDLEKGQNIVLLQDQFPSNYYAWKEKAAAEEAELRTVPRPDGGNWTPGVLAAIDRDTAIATLPVCHWTDGTAVDLEAVGARCREVGAALVIDATQSIGAHRFDVDKVRPDFLICSAYKWLLCPYTLAFLYAAPHRCQGQPLEHNYGGRADAATQSGGVGYSDTLLPTAARYDMGERYNYASLPMACVALEQLNAWGVGEIEDTIGVLTDMIADEAGSRGYKVADKAHRARNFIGLGAPGGLPDGLTEKLAAENVHVAPRGQAIRVSPHLYNDAEDVERLFAALDRHIPT